MSADPGTRDGEIVRQIGKAQEVVGQLQEQLREIVAHAEQHDAIGHAALYRAVEVDLDVAWQRIGAAYDTMSDGDPEDYA